MAAAAPEGSGMVTEAGDPNSPGQDLKTELVDPNSSGQDLETTFGDLNSPGQDLERELVDPNSPEDLEPKLISVCLWIKQMYGDCPVPSFEVNRRTVEILQNFKKCFEDRERDVSVLIEHLKQQRAQHKAETKEFRNIFKDLGLSPRRLSRKAYKCLSSLAKSAVILETKDTSLPSLFCAISNMTSNRFRARQKNKKMTRKLDIIKKKLALTLMLQEQVLGDIEKLEERQVKEIARSEKRSRRRKFMADKSLEYSIRMKNGMEELIARGLEKSLTHSALVEFYEELASLQHKVRSLKKEVQIYLDLPLSIPLAKVKVEEEKLELKRLRDDIWDALDAVPFEIF